MYAVFRAGEVSAIDHEKGKVRVLLIGDEEKTTDWLNILVPYSESHTENFMYKVGQTVYCLFFEEFQEQGVVIGTPMRGSLDNANQVKTVYNDGSFISYKDGELVIHSIDKILVDSKNKIKFETKDFEIKAETVKVTAKEIIKIDSNTLDINSKSSMSITSPVLNIKSKVTINGDLTVTGTTKTGGSINLNTHIHTKVTPGGGVSGGPQ